MITKMYLTEEDHKILMQVENYGSITISQCQKLFYNTQAKGYEMARKHLSKLVQYKKLLIDKDIHCKRNVYFTTKKPGYHKILVLDFYSELIKHGAVIRNFRIEQPWINKKYKSDAYICYTIGNKVFFDILEVVRTKNVEIQTYKDIFNSGEAQALNNELYKQLGGQSMNKFPRLIIIDEVQHTNKLQINNEIIVIQLDFNLSNFSQLFI